MLQSPFDGRVSFSNSTTTVLGIGGIFTGTAEEILSTGVVIVSVYSDVASATDGLSVQFSCDGTNWDHTDVFTIPAGVGKTFSFQPACRYFRVVYTNGGTGQATFRLQSILKTTYVKPSSHRIQDEIITEDDAELVKSVITGQKPNGDFTNFHSTRLGNFPVSLEEYQGDAFGRLRVSEPYTIFDNSLCSATSNTLFWNQLVGGTGSGSHSILTSSYTMTTTTNGDYCIRQTKQRFKYQPGKSHMTLITGLLNTEAGQIKRVGLIDYDNINLASITNAPQNGVCFTNNEGVLSFCIYNNGTMTESVEKANWNIDICDGTGKSGFTLDVNSTNIFFIDMEWLGVGAVRCGFVADNGQMVVAHQFRHASNSYTNVYMRTANLPVSYAITSTTGAGSMKQICCSVISEGGFNPQGITSAITNVNSVSISSGDTELLIGIRLKAESFEFTVEPTFVSVLSTSSADSIWTLSINPTYSGTVTWADVPNSEVQYAENNNNVVSDIGIIISQGSFSGDVDSLNEEIKSSLKIGKGLDDSLDALWLSVKAFGNETYYGTINFRQFI